MFSAKIEGAGRREIPTATAATSRVRHIVLYSMYTSFETVYGAEQEAFKDDPEVLYPGYGHHTGITPFDSDHRTSEDLKSRRAQGIARTSMYIFCNFGTNRILKQ
jgi:hypothetical protein